MPSNETLGFRNTPFRNLSHFGNVLQNGIFAQELSVLMPFRFGSVVACLLAPRVGATTLVLRSYAVPESTLLFLVGGGLIVLASLVRRLYPLGEVAAPKSIQVHLWMSPPQRAEQFADGDRAEFVETAEPDYRTTVV